MTQSSSSNANPGGTTVHVRVNGQSQEFPLAVLDLAPSASDEQLRRAVAEHLELPLAQVSALVVVREQQGITVRPEAMYG